ncbi:hypothetical protein P12x_005287 [Tundrisphaera lichenicola]|uniref:hypothetical protein n=1 Tax=Tundrisphaera lichenicola TaxID=2029860 RepID=UPI003EBC4D00
MKLFVALSIAGLSLLCLEIWSVADTEGYIRGLKDGYCLSPNANETLCAGRDK